MIAARATHRGQEDPGGHEEDLLALEEESPGEVEIARPVSWALQVAKVERSIYDLYRSWERKVLQLDPDFEREFVWDENRQSQLIESVLARIPLPAFYLSEEDEDQTIVIDGQQRLATIFRYMQDTLVLRGLSLLPELNGRRFSELEGKLQRRFESTALTCFVLQPGTDSSVKFHIFERLNLGGVALNAQEIRNGLFQGPGLDAIKHLARDTAPGSFLDVVGSRQIARRMKADELILRALAVLDLGPHTYAGSTSQLLNDQLLRLNRLPTAQIQDLESRLRNALARTKVVFGEHAFRRYNTIDGTWTSQLNGPLVEILIFGFDKYFPRDKALTQATADEVLKRFQNMCSDASFREAITSATQATSMVRRRFDMWMKELSDVA
jgi:hypothetical protein